MTANDNAPTFYGTQRHLEAVAAWLVRTLGVPVERAGAEARRMIDAALKG